MRYSVRTGMTGALLMLALMVLISVGTASAATDPINVNVTVDDYLTITSPADVALANIAGPGASSTGSATWQVVTNNSTGYKLEIEASSSPALTSADDSFADYAGAGVWSIGGTESAFGFSVNDTTSYQNLTGTTPVQIRNTATPTAGEDTTVYFKAQVGASRLQVGGDYSASLTVTATTL